MECPADHQHQSSCYVRHGCRCNKCRAWSAARKQSSKKNKFEPWQIQVAKKVFGVTE